jgi:hypothetical protein
MASEDALDRDVLFRKMRAKSENKVRLWFFNCVVGLPGRFWNDPYFFAWFFRVVVFTAFFHLFIFCAIHVLRES